MAIKYKLMVPNGQYDKDGQTKTNWLKIGNIFSTENGFSMKIDCIPTYTTNREGEQVAWDGWVKMFEPNTDTHNSSGQKQGGQQGSGTHDDFDDSIPF